MRRKWYIIKIGQVRYALTFPEAAGFLKVWHDDVDGSDLQQPSEPICEIMVFSGADRSTGRFSDVAIGLHIFSGDRFLQPHQAEWLKTLCNLLPRHGIIPSMHIDTDVNLRSDSFSNGCDLVVHSIEFGRAGRP